MIAAIVVIADVKAETTEVQAEAEIVGLRGVGREDEERGAEERGQSESVATAAVAFVGEVGVLFHRCVSYKSFFAGFRNENSPIFVVVKLFKEKCLRRLFWRCFLRPTMLITRNGADFTEIFSIF
jgi:hypothetical protein